MEKKKTFVKGLAVVGGCFFAFFAPFNIVEGYIVTGIIEAVGLPLIFAIYLLNRKDYVDEAANIALVTMIIVLVSQLFTGGLYDSVFLWCYTFPVLSFFLKGSKKGAFWVLALILICASIFIVDRALVMQMLPFENNLFLMFVFSYYAEATLLYIYEKAAEKSDNLVVEQINALKMYELVIKNVSQHIIITDIDGKIIYANPAVERITGYSNQEVIGAKPSLWGKQMPKEYYEKMWFAIKNKRESFVGEIINRRKNGEKYTAAAVISPVADEKGVLRYFVGVETDISVQKKLEESILLQKENVEKKGKAILNLLEDIEEEKTKVEQTVVERTRQLREEQARLLSSINSLSFGFIVSDMFHRVILKNSAVAELLGEKADKIESVEQIAKLLSEKVDVNKLIEKCLKTRTETEVNEVMYGKKSIRVIVAPIKTVDEWEEMIGYVLLLEDITEEKVMERSRDEFFALASHELRTPLTAIRGNLEMLLDFDLKLKSGEKKDMLKDIFDGSTRLIAIVNDFLDISRLEQGRITFKKEKFDLVKLSDSVIAKLDSLAKAKNISLSLKKSKSKLPEVYADPDRTTQVLFNLIGNAINYTEKGGVSVEIEKEDKLLYISVSDTGKGIPLENQTLLFRKFQQAGEKILTRDATSGTGLGLYIAKHIIEGMGGTIELKESKPGKGSTFRFSLPIA